MLLSSKLTKECKLLYNENITSGPPSKKFGDPCNKTTYVQLSNPWKIESVEVNFRMIFQYFTAKIMGYYIKNTKYTYTSMSRVLARESGMHNT